AAEEVIIAGVAAGVVGAVVAVHAIHAIAAGHLISAGSAVHEVVTGSAGHHIVAAGADVAEGHRAQPRSGRADHRADLVVIGVDGGSGPGQQIRDDGAVVAEHAVITSAAVHLIGAEVSDHVVVAVAAGHGVVAEPAPFAIIAAVAVDVIVAADGLLIEQRDVADDGVVFQTHAVARGGARGVAEERAAAGRPRDRAVVADDDIVVVAAADVVGAVGCTGLRAAADQVVIAGSAGHRIIAGVA